MSSTTTPKETTEFEVGSSNFVSPLLSTKHKASNIETEEQKTSKTKVVTVKIGDPLYTLPQVPVRILSIEGSPICRTFEKYKTFDHKKARWSASYSNNGFDALHVVMHNERVAGFDSVGLKDCNNVTSIDFELIE